MKRALALVTFALLAGCRGQPSQDPPIHLVPDMDWQDKYRPEQESKFFSDGRTMRPLIEGTVSEEHLDDDDAYFRGKSGEDFVGIAPIKVDAKTLARGQERFGIYCTPCHDKTGSGHGMVVQRGFPIPVDLSSDRVRGLPDGQLFDTITHGVRNMPAYGPQIPVADRWAIVSWVRVIERSQHASLSDVPAEMQSRIDPEGATP